ncbi:MAG: hypothetical protein A2821_00605 [Candidatus Magasanikbacteria bacterium RIFCSPHIGHO2_01_FULL_41_23]|uniref:Clp R domain-containing protein n=1 Tax=Candidatus Magasanikbacteria bacterium RIFCSPLOWO2_01_FULL_40_15 TaxID=1798686 RepID=A0A1F6N0I7_9BACT|nr:MAG: hypothetical protein A2821_00605 [Candidatus Magasanikbacteria bacterium RIFCSPHIGHO2_01_FULL_41_23]OGH74676.1 MAG: hypothetical protein A3F22_01960 [Candidatus Magasanikbacteria bacterium RIFCSPHIGHO2_12_FULL_41_16]OGH77391.1 MAG: hypothetical protein A2983_01660 [Candidatus Magasanikbacteria bacterium RIFCSPLOWO2_01_FULL_40_15]
MQFSQNEKFNVIRCANCSATGLKGLFKCSFCLGRGRGFFLYNEFWYWTWPLSAYDIALRRGRDFLNAFQIMTALIFGLGFVGLFFWDIYRMDFWLDLFSFDFWSRRHLWTKSFFWLGIGAFSYVWYRIVQSNKPIALLRNYTNDEAPEIVQLDWEQLKKIPKVRSLNISETFTVTAKHTLDTAFKLAVTEKSAMIEPKHLFLALIDQPMVGNMFIRLGISPETVKVRVSTFEITKTKNTIEPVMSDIFEQILFAAYEISAKTHDSHVRESALLLATVRAWPALQEILYDLNIDSVKLDNVVAWVRIREQLREDYLALRQASAHRDTHGIDRAMTAVATPFLNSFSEDLTLKAQLGYLYPCVARDNEIDAIFRIIEGGQQSVLLVGSPGVGKMSIIEGIAERMVQDRVPDRLKDKRLVQVSTSSLLAGTTVSGAQERLIKIMNELARARNIILVINNVTDLIGGEDAQQESGMNVAGTLAEYLSGGHFLTLATTQPDAYHKHIANSELSSIFAKVEISIMDENQAIQVLESKAGQVEYKHNVFFSYDALARCVQHANRYLHDQYLPESALTLFSESASLAHSKHPAKPLVTTDDVAAVIGQKTGIPATSISEDESSKLLRLETEMHKRVVGQNEAVVMVASALRRARAEIRSKGRPIANFLFLGPTGVGKTELAKTIADVYFGREDRMIRVDMSEYQDKSGIYRLIGQIGQQGTGLLTEAVREKPFSLILLDELEKADPNVLNLFLQVFDDGRLTDSIGRVIDFTNTIIIATSNAGTTFIQEAVRAGTPTDQIREKLLRSELKNYYRPEFLNRFDGIIVFTPLNREEIKQIAGFMLKRVAKDLEARGIDLRVEDAGLEALSQIGYDPEFGARPMRRAIQEHVEDQLAELILSGKLQRRDIIVVGENAKISIERAGLPLPT